jgi:hypothetical protein
MCVYIQLQYCGNLEASEEPNNNIYCQNDILLPICFSFFFLVMYLLSLELKMTKTHFRQNLKNENFTQKLFFNLKTLLLKCHFKQALKEISEMMNNLHFCKLYQITCQIVK